MMPEQQNWPPLIAAESSILSIDAFLGALDDSVAEFNSTDANRRADNEIMASISGMRDTASAYYNDAYVAQLGLMEAFDRRLEAMCNEHGEFGAALTAYQAEQAAAHTHKPGETHEHEQTEASKKKKKKEKEAAKKRKQFKATGKRVLSFF